MCIRDSVGCAQDGRKEPDAEKADLGLTAEVKPATDFTAKANAAVYDELDFDDKQELSLIHIYHEDIQKCLAAGMNAHLSKPINIDRAVRTIQGRKRICG